MRCCAEADLSTFNFAVEITGTSGNLLIAREQGKLDVVIGRMLTLSDRNYVFRPIGDEALSVIAAVDHPLAMRSAGLRR